MKCRRKEAGPGWEPDYWQNLCPHPFCPSYRQVARLLSLFTIGLLIWGIVFFIAGEYALNYLTFYGNHYIWSAFCVPPFVTISYLNLEFENLKVWNVLSVGPSIYLSVSFWMMQDVSHFSVYKIFGSWQLFFWILW